mmetsp:Transcript_50106/g.160312  ORF Transcript_50106/g.160312 Transcript_50106/m.160312 type:complete len:222 (+) Transcript_50106:512-1177(+)
MPGPKTAGLLRSGTPAAEASASAASRPSRVRSSSAVQAGGTTQAKGACQEQCTWNACALSLPLVKSKAKRPCAAPLRPMTRSARWYLRQPCCTRPAWASRAARIPSAWWKREPYCAARFRRAQTAAGAPARSATARRALLAPSATRRGRPAGSAPPMASAGSISAKARRSPSRYGYLISTPARAATAKSRCRSRCHICASPRARSRAEASCPAAQAAKCRW